MTALSPGALDAVVVGQAQIQWFDDLVSGVVVFEEDWYFWASRGAPSGANSLAGSGPMHGRYMLLTITIPTTAATGATLQYINVFGSNRTVPYSDWRQNSLSVAPECDGLAYISGGGIAFDNTLCNVNAAAVGASSSYWLPIGLYSGPAYFHMRFSGAQLASPVIVNCEGIVGGQLSVGTACIGQLVAEAGSANTDYYGTILLPRAPVRARLRGTGSSINSYISGNRATGSIGGIVTRILAVLAVIFSATALGVIIFCRVPGPPGPQGNQGSQGIQGLQGNQGPIGPVGPAYGPAYIAKVCPDPQTINVGSYFTPTLVCS
jgi:hypothetical protein